MRLTGAHCPQVVSATPCQSWHESPVAQSELSLQIDPAGRVFPVGQTPDAGHAPPVLQQIEPWEQATSPYA